ncbi:phospholipase-like protein [Tanacetum coccineum]
MENTHSVFDAKVTIRGTLHTLTSINELLGQSVNERRRTRFLSTVFGKWLDFPAYSNDNLLLNYNFQHEVKREQNNDVCPPIRYKIAKLLKKVRVSDLLELIRKPKMWSALSDEDTVKVCLLLVSNIVFMGRESKNYIADNLIELVDDLSAWDAYPWGEYFWRALYRSHGLKELAAVKQMMNAIERFIKSKNDNLSEDSVAKQTVEKEIKSSDGKADSAISNVLIGEISCQNLVQEQLQSRDMCIQSITNQIVQHPLESPKGKSTESSILDVFHGELSVVETSKNEALSEEFDPKEYDKNVDDSGVGKASEIINVLTGQVSCDKYVGGFYECESSKLYYTDPKEYPSSSMTQLLEAAVPKQTSSQMLAYTPLNFFLEYAEYDFDNPENDSLSDMVKTGEEEIHLDGSKIVDHTFVQTPNKQNSEACLVLYFLSCIKILEATYTKTWGPHGKH